MRTTHTRPMTGGLSLVELSWALVPVDGSAPGRRNTLPFRPRRHGHRFPRGDFHVFSIGF